MMALGKILLLVAVMECCSTSSSANGHPQVRTCSSSADCEKNECCVAHPHRYSTPYCSSLRQRGDPCVPTSRRIDSTVVQPGYTFANVYWILCPCAPSLSCNWFTGLCGTKEDYPYTLLNEV